MIAAQESSFPARERRDRSPDRCDPRRRSRCRVRSPAGWVKGSARLSIAGEPGARCSAAGQRNQKKLRSKLWIVGRGLILSEELLEPLPALLQLEPGVLLLRDPLVEIPQLPRQLLLQLAQHLLLDAGLLLRRLELLLRLFDLSPRRMRRLVRHSLFLGAAVALVELRDLRL